MTSSEATLAYVEEYLAEDEPLRTARMNAEEVGGAAPVGPAAGAALRFLTAAIGAKAVAEIGTGCGTSGIWLLRGMRPDGVLTSVDVEPEHQRLARDVFKEAGFASNRYRLISGRALDVLPRLTDGGYDMVFCDAAKQEYLDYLAEGLRLLLLCFFLLPRRAGVTDWRASAAGSACRSRCRPWWFRLRRSPRARAPRCR